MEMFSPPPPRTNPGDGYLSHPRSADPPRFIPYNTTLRRVSRRWTASLGVSPTCRPISELSAKQHPGNVDSGSATRKPTAVTRILLLSVVLLVLLPAGVSRADFNSGEIDEFLMTYISSYETFTDSINGVSTLIFAAFIYLISRKFGIVHNDSIMIFRHSWILFVCGFLCIVAFVSNFLIHGAIANFFSEAYQGKFDTDCNQNYDFPVEYFNECVRKAKLRIYGSISLASCVLASLSLFIWSCVNLR